MIPNPFRASTTSIVAVLAAAGTASCAHNPAPTPSTTPGKIAAIPHPAPTPLPAPPARAFNLREPLTPAQAKWVDSTLTTLSLRDRVGQMEKVCVFGVF